MEQIRLSWRGIVFLLVLLVTGSIALFAVLTPLFILTLVSRAILHTKNRLFRRIYDFYRQAAHTMYAQSSGNMRFSRIKSSRFNL